MSGAKYIKSVIDGNTYCKTNGQFSRHLKNNNLTYQNYYEKYVTGTSPTCGCGKSLSFYQKNQSYANSCGDPLCVGKTISRTKRDWHIDKREKDSQNKKLAASRRTQNQIQQQVEKTRKTFNEKYGVEWVTQSTEYKDKSKQTKLERYGNEYYANSGQTSKSWQIKTDSEIAEIVDKRRATCLERFGVENALMKPIARINSAKSNSNGRNFVLPSGKILGVRGYEDIVITELLKTHAEDNLLFDDRHSVYSLPVFSYVNANQHTMKYYPDIYILKENKIIEVKSQWWWDGNGNEKYKSRLVNNLRKKDAVLRAGYNYEVWLFKSKIVYEILTWK